MTDIQKDLNKDLKKLHTLLGKTRDPQVAEALRKLAIILSSWRYS